MTLGLRAQVDGKRRDQLAAYIVQSKKLRVGECVGKGMYSCGRWLLNRGI